MRLCVYDAIPSAGGAGGHPPFQPGPGRLQRWEYGMGDMQIPPENGMAKSRPRLASLAAATNDPCTHRKHDFGIIPYIIEVVFGLLHLNSQ